MTSTPDHSPASYNLAMRLLHWLVVLILLPMYLLALSIEGQPLADNPGLLRWHVLGGLGLMFVMVLRLFVTGLSAKPPLPAPARIVFGLLYLFLLLVPLFGYFLLTETSLSLQDVIYLNLSETGDSHRSSLFHQLHSTMAWVLAGLVCLHLLVVLKSLFIDRQNVLKKMLKSSN